ncbi:MAG: 16S rRNA (cytosine(1402)-N(4))-methyltransferase RsmH, partial [Lentisphaerae bacterium]|nr:16S rRNA (cytosine(1402)-N(4))-methyltransferase RsmH [Lentisphaerota bacterium]
MHEPVMVQEVLTLLAVQPGGIYMDGTLGGGGHARAILERLAGQGLLLGIDRDSAALAQAACALAAWPAQCRLAQGNFNELDRLAAAHNIQTLDGLLLDLGMSSLQLDAPARGFSFHHAGPLDMRMDRAQPLTAAAWLAAATEREIAQQLRKMGDEPDARRIARAIVRERAREPLLTTQQLADLVLGVKRGRRGKIHPATRTFQALRMIVNRELECLEEGLLKGWRLLRPGGRLAVLAYHSLEDRIVKHFARQHIGRWESLPAGGRRWLGQEPAARWLTPKPLTPSAAE